MANNVTSSLEPSMTCDNKNQKAGRNVPEAGLPPFSTALLRLLQQQTNLGHFRAGELLRMFLVVLFLLLAPIRSNIGGISGGRSYGTLVASAQTLKDRYEISTDTLRLRVDSKFGSGPKYHFQLGELDPGDSSISRLLVRQDATSVVTKNNTYSSTKILGVIEGEQALRVTFALQGTTETATAHFYFESPGVLQVTLSAENDWGVQQIAEQFLDQKEHYYGTWEAASESRKIDQLIDPWKLWRWLQDSPDAALDNRGVDRNLHGVDLTYGVSSASARAPFYITSRRYGIYVPTQSEGRYSIAKSGKTKFQFHVHPTGPQLRYYILTGSYRDILSHYNRLAGAAVMPPTWALGTIWWRDQTRQEQVLEDASLLQSKGIRASAIILDRPVTAGPGPGTTGLKGWGDTKLDPVLFPQPDQMVDGLQAKGLNLMLWVANRASGKLKQSAVNHLSQPGDAPAVDLRSPQARAIFREHLGHFSTLGIKGYKIDRGDEGEMPAAIVNENLTLFGQTAYESFGPSSDEAPFLFARAVHDSGRKYTAVWNGDPWPHPFKQGLKASVINALRCSAMNMPVWASDTGGYAPDPELLKKIPIPVGLFTDADEETVFARWLQFSCYTPISLIYIAEKGSLGQKWSNPFREIIVKYTGEHHDLIPYIRSTLYEATQSGWPVMRPMTFVYPQEPRFSNMWQQYLFGGELLIAPVTDYEDDRKSVELPAGQWIDYNNRKTVYQGNQRIIVPAPVGTIPVFARAGAIIPRGDILQANNPSPDWQPRLKVEFFPVEQVVSTFAYYTGQKVQPIHSELRNGRLQIVFGDLGTPGKLEIYCRNASSITRNGQVLVEGGDYTYDRRNQKLIIPFDGATTVVINSLKSLFE